MTERAISPPLKEWTRVPSISDTDVLMAIYQRKPAALGQLYDRYGRLVFVVALRITSDQPTAEMVTQDVFDAVWTGIDGMWLERGSCAAWLLGLTRRHALAATHHRDMSTPL